MLITMVKLFMKQIRGAYYIAIIVNSFLRGYIIDARIISANRMMKRRRFQTFV
jgi:hypothetical protein